MVDIEFTQSDIDQAAQEIALAKTRARTRFDWSLIADAERGLAAARLQAARQTVRHIDRDWTPQNPQRS